MLDTARDQPSTRRHVFFSHRPLILLQGSFTSHRVQVTWGNLRLTLGVQGTALPDHCSHDVTRLSPNQRRWPAGHKVPIAKPCVPDSCLDQRWSGSCPMEGAPTERQAARITHLHHQVKPFTCCQRQTKPRLLTGTTSAP